MNYQSIKNIKDELICSDKNPLKSGRKTIHHKSVHVGFYPRVKSQIFLSGVQERSLNPIDTACTCNWPQNVTNVFIFFLR